MHSEVQRHYWRHLARIFGISAGMSFAFTLFFTLGDSPMIRLSPFVAALVYGLPFGTVFSVMDRLRVNQRKFPSFMVTVLFRTTVHVLGIVVAFYLSIGVTIWLQTKVTFGNPELYRAAWEVITMPIMVSTIALSFTVVFLISAGFAVSRKLGPGVGWNWLRGYYHHPREEERIFMFLDMKDSTTLAERLGNRQFSALVRDFFQDLTNPVIETRGEVSHYIGDEAVLTWRMDRGLPEANCLRCFFLMQAAVAKRSAFYLATYGLVPAFKAGMHCGPVVTTEVGEIKSEIVFHGDVLNTTARIEGLCNALGADLLVSEELVRQLPSVGLELRDCGEQVLKGKEQRMHVYAVRVAG